MNLKELYKRCSRLNCRCAKAPATDPSIDCLSAKPAAGPKEIMYAMPTSSTSPNSSATCTSCATRSTKFARSIQSLCDTTRILDRSRWTRIYPVRLIIGGRHSCRHGRGLSRRRPPPVAEEKRDDRNDLKDQPKSPEARLHRHPPIDPGPGAVQLQ